MFLSYQLYNLSGGSIDATFSDVEGGGYKFLFVGKITSMSHPTMCSIIVRKVQGKKYSFLTVKGIGFNKSG